MKKFINSTLNGGNGEVSSKRVVTLLAFLLAAVGFIANLFWGFVIEEFIYKSMMYIVIAGLGIVGAEKFAPKKKDLDENT
tara:strand:- start:1509 stop:1748 length:240 start_codon:yes stop_codon:yes gene_type:complete